jgi:serine/threonine protein kinase
MSVPAAQWSFSDRLGRYRVLAVLAQGGMGNVYLAAAEGMEGFSKFLVVKELRREQAEDEFHVTMFMDEARLAVRLNHPNIVQTIEVGSDGARRFLVMEHLDGQPLHRVLRRARKDGQPLSLDLYVRVLVDVLEALACAHELSDFDGTPLGFVHRDVSHQNVFLTYEGQVKLIDFGIAKTLLASQQTNAGVLKGKIRYMAPEQATGHAVDRRTDVFSVGVMLWDALVGHGPWEGHNDMQILRCLVTGAIPRLADQPHHLPADLVAAVDRAMSPDIEDRYPTARLMHDELLRCLAPAPGAGHARALREVVSRLFAQERQEQNTCELPATGGPNNGPPVADIGTSDVYAPTCGTLPGGQLPPNVADFLGPIQPMVFVVPKASSQQSISASAAYFVFGFGADSGVAPWDGQRIDLPAQLRVRRAGAPCGCDRRTVVALGRRGRRKPGREHCGGHQRRRGRHQLARGRPQSGAGHRHPGRHQLRFDDDDPPRHARLQGF